MNGSYFLSKLHGMKRAVSAGALAVIAGGTFLVVRCPNSPPVDGVTTASSTFPDPEAKAEPKPEKRIVTFDQLKQGEWSTGT